MRSIFLFSLFLYFSLSKAIDQNLNAISNIEETLFTTWATAIISTENPQMELSNNSIRQIIHVSASGEKIRLKLSNIKGKENLEIKEVTIADSSSQGTGEINIDTLKSLSFNGEKSTIISPGKEMYSDIISYSLKPLSEIAISIYFGTTQEFIRSS